MCVCVCIHTNMYHVRAYPHKHVPTHTNIHRNNIPKKGGDANKINRHANRLKHKNKKNIRTLPQTPTHKDTPQHTKSEKYTHTNPSRRNYTVRIKCVHMHVCVHTCTYACVYVRHIPSWTTIAPPSLPLLWHIKILGLPQGSISPTSRC